MLQLPHFLRILGPSSLTLYKHVLGRRRILIYTPPPVEPACVLCQVVADMCFEDQTLVESVEGGSMRPRERGKLKEGINVLGVITLHDINLLEDESNSGRGWIACAFYALPFHPFFYFLTDSPGTTDAVFMEKPQYYDLVVDMTSRAPTLRKGAECPLAKTVIPPLHDPLHVERRETGMYSHPLSPPPTER
jgi:DENN domain-containing protein 11